MVPIVTLENQNRRISGPVLVKEVQKALLKPEDRANEIPASLLKDLEEHDQEERKQMAENINKKNKERLEERK